jgi:hypothetical protein
MRARERTRNRKSRRPPVIAMTAQPTAERIRQSRGGFEVGDGDKTIRMIDSQLARALGRALINKGQYEAGQKFKAHWYHAGMEPIKAANFEFAIGGGDGFQVMPKSEFQAHHRQQYRQAVKELGPSAGLIESVVCDGMGYEAAERCRFGDIIGFATKPQAITAAQRELQIGLERLRVMWGL